MSALQLSRPNVPARRARALVFEDPASRALLKRIEQIAPTDATVLITGETGTGKEIVARYVHERSARGRAPFVAVNCGALSPGLMESELFGHERGAFTGALTSNAGWFEEAHGATLFLDEIGELPLGAQVKLLRVLQEREVVRIGARRAIPVDVRVIAATNAKLEEAVAAGRFREDLYYRLNVARLALAPLRERPGDVLPLAKHFLDLYGPVLGGDRVELTPEAVDRIVAHPWRGNIRELENAVHHAALVSRGGLVTPQDLLLSESEVGATASSRLEQAAASSSESERARAALEAAVRLLLSSDDGSCLHRSIEEIVFATAYAASDRNQLQTARLLGISRNVVRARLVEYGLLEPVARAPSARGRGERARSVSLVVPPARPRASA